MKAQRRHELQQNVLDAELGRLVSFFKRRGNLIAWGLLGAVLVVLVLWYAHNQNLKRAAAVQSQYDQLAQAQGSPASEEQVLRGFRDLTQQTRIKWIAADACVRVGNIYSRQMLASASPADRQDLGRQAADYYRKAIEDFPEERMAAAKAHLGLAKLAESRGDFAKARGEYQAILEMKMVQGYPVAALAKQGLENLPVLESPVSMATTLPTQPATASAPAASEPATAPEAQPPPAKSPEPKAKAEPKGKAKTEPKAKASKAK